MDTIVLGRVHHSFPNCTWIMDPHGPGHRNSKPCGVALLDRLRMSQEEAKGPCSYRISIQSKQYSGCRMQVDGGRESIIYASHQLFEGHTAQNTETNLEKK